MCFATANSPAICPSKPLSLASVLDDSEPDNGQSLLQTRNITESWLQGSHIWPQRLKGKLKSRSTSGWSQRQAGSDGRAGWLLGCWGVWGAGPAPLPEPTGCGVVSLSHSLPRPWITLGFSLQPTSWAQMWLLLPREEGAPLSPSLSLAPPLHGKAHSNRALDWEAVRPGTSI